MIKILRLVKEKRARDRKRKRLIVSFGRTRLHVTRAEAVELLVKLQEALIK